MADREKVAQRLITLLREQGVFAQDPETLMDKHLVEDGVIDSLTLTQLLALVQEAFSIAIDERLMIERLHSISDVIDYLTQQTT
jgi:acyl carrier protein